MNKIFTLSLTFFISVLCKAVSYAQCTNHVTHTTGVQQINDVNVNVTSFGSVYNYAAFACSTPYNYMVGYFSNEGSYTFTFSPAVESLSMNFFRINNNQQFPEETHIEEIQLFVNNIHYSVPSLGEPFTDCNLNYDLHQAIITSEGNLMADPNLQSGSVKDLIIQGPIQNLTVLDHIITGDPQGVFFSLFICNGVLSQTEFLETSNPIIFPNPFFNHCTLKLPENASWKLTLTNLHGQTLRTSTIVGDQIEIERENLAAGIYLVKVESGRQSLNGKICIKD